MKLSLCTKYVIFKSNLSHKLLPLLSILTLMELMAVKVTNHETIL